MAKLTSEETQVLLMALLTYNPIASDHKEMKLIEARQRQIARDLADLVRRGKNLYV